MSVHVCLRVSVCVSLAMKNKRAGLRWGAAPSSWPVTQLPVKRSSVYHRTTALRQPLPPAPPSYFLPTRCDLYPVPAVLFPLFRSTTDTWLPSRWQPPVKLSGRGPARLSPAHQWGFFFFPFGVGHQWKELHCKKEQRTQPKGLQTNQWGFELRILFKSQGPSTGYMAEPSPLGSSQVQFNYKGLTRFSPYTPTGLKPKPFLKKVSKFLEGQYHLT